MTRDEYIAAWYQAIANKIRQSKTACIMQVHENGKIRREIVKVIKVGK